jgi:hypothetical protein
VLPRGSNSCYNAFKSAQRPWQGTHNSETGQAPGLPIPNELRQLRVSWRLFDAALAWVVGMTIRLSLAFGTYATIADFRPIDLTYRIMSPM